MTMLYVVIACGLLSVLYAIWATRSVLAADQGNARMQEIASAIREGAQAYLTRQYTTIAIVGVIVFIIAWWLLGASAAIGFLIGAVLSAAAGFIGMHVSVRANVRTAQASANSLAAGLDIAFKSGAITGLLVAGLALLGVSVYFWVLIGPMGNVPTDRIVIDALVALGFGASLISIFARLGGRASSPRVPMSAVIWSARWKRVFRRMIHATLRPSPTMWVTMSVTALAWLPIFSRPMW